MPLLVTSVCEMSFERVHVVSGAMRSWRSRILPTTRLYVITYPFRASGTAAPL